MNFFSKAFNRSTYISRGDKINLGRLFSNFIFVSSTTSQTVTMVKKRIRDPEVLEEAPPPKSGADDSGSDDVNPLLLFPTNTADRISGRGYGQC